MVQFTRVLRDIFNNGFGVVSRGLTKKNNAIIVSRSDQFAGESTKDLPFTEFYNKYHQWPQAQRAINSIHRRMMGSGMQVSSEDDIATELIEKWMELINFRTKVKRFGKDTLITGTGFLERQFSNRMFASIEHIPTKTIFKIFRDRFARILQVTQLVDGERQDLDPDNVVVFAINNPENEALGKSVLHSIISPQHVAADFDENGNAINPERYVPSILDRQARILAAQLENAENLARARVFVKIDEPDRERQQELEKSIANPNSKKWIHVTNKDIEVKEAQISQQNKIAEPVQSMNDQIDLATSYPSRVMIEGGSMGFASSQTPVKDFNETIQDIQNDLAEVIQDQIFRPLLEQWGFDYAKVKPRLKFEPFVEELSFEEFLQIDPKRVSDKEYRDYLRKRIPTLNDGEFEEWKETNRETMQSMTNNGGVNNTDPANDRPDIEDDAPEPPNTNSLESAFPAILRNPKKFETYVEHTIDKILSEESTIPIHVNMNNNTDKFDSGKPKITDEQVRKRLKELQKLLEERKNADKNKQPELS